MLSLDQAGRCATVTHRRNVAPALADIIECISIVRYPASAPCTWRVVADFAPHLIYQQRTGRAPEHRVLLVGARSRFTDIDVRGRALTVVARLRPGVIPALFGLAATELTDTGYYVRDVLSCNVAPAIERMITEISLGQDSAMERFLLSLPIRRPVDPRIHFASSRSVINSSAIDDLARGFGMTTRGLHAMMNREAGLSPKRFGRIRRLHLALSAGMTRVPFNWTAAALDAVFFDQAHLTHECTALLGEGPMKFARRRTD
jgi:AraC-like DNA-binding protein